MFGRSEGIAVKFSEKLKQLREAVGPEFTQDDLAKRSQVPVTTIRGYEQGKRLPLAPAFMRLVKALGVTCDAFADCDDMAGDDNPKSKPKRK